MARPAAPREALPPDTGTVEHWALDAGDEPRLVAAEADCRAAVVDVVARAPRAVDPPSATDCDEATLHDRLAQPDVWSDFGIRPELSDLIALHNGRLEQADEVVVGPRREAVTEAMGDVLARRGWSPPGTAWAISGHLWYRAGSALGWHTNTRVPGWRAYLSWTAEPDASFFRYRDLADGRIVTSWDTGVDLRLFHVSDTEPFWHCINAGAERHSFGFRLVDAPG